FEDAGARDGGVGDSGCVDIDRRTCDDIDLAISANGNVVATRFRASLGGDPVSIRDLAFAASTESVPEGRYAVRSNGQPGLCEVPITVSGEVSASADTQNCRQTRMSTRSFWRVNFGPALVLLISIRLISLIMRRARGKQAGRTNDRER